MNFSEIWERIKKETTIKTLSELANVAGTTQPNVSKKKKDEIFPVEWAYRVAQKFGILTEWIMTGEGPKVIDDKETSTPLASVTSYGIIEEWVQYIRDTEGHDGRIVASLMRDSEDFRDWFSEKDKKKKANVA